MNNLLAAARVALIGFGLCCLAGSLQAAPAANDAGACSVKSRSDRVVILVCPPGASQEVLRSAGVAACQGHTAGCNAWIWDNPTKAPMKAPAIDTDMPKSTTGSARAVWLNESQSLMEVRKAR